jgi:hypothetical protein
MTVQGAHWKTTLLAAALVGVLGGPAQAAAPKPPTIEISVIHALHVDGGLSIDPRLRDLPQLTREQPFVRYNVYKLLGRKELVVEAGRPVTERLVDGRALQVTLLDANEQDGRNRFHMRVAIDEPGKGSLLKLLEVTASGNEPFFVGGQSYQGGTLFLELIVRP